MFPEPDPEAIRAGDRATFDSLYCQLSPRIRGYIFRLCRDRSLADDVTQETFLAAFAGCRAYSGRSRALAWLLGIATRRLSDAHRRSRETPQEIPERRALDHTESAALNAVQLEKALSRLDPTLRETFLLIAGEGLTYAETASALAIKLGLVKWRMHAATRRLRALMTEGEENAGIR
jgi:RNA polymerase sigma-70 factor, ECF subfamily